MFLLCVARAALKYMRKICELWIYSLFHISQFLHFSMQTCPNRMMRWENAAKCCSLHTWCTFIDKISGLSRSCALNWRLSCSFDSRLGFFSADSKISLPQSKMVASVWIFVWSFVRVLVRLLCRIVFATFWSFVDHSWWKWRWWYPKSFLYGEFCEE